MPVFDAWGERGWANEEEGMAQKECVCGLVHVPDRAGMTRSLTLYCRAEWSSRWKESD
jgi:hypothetical protein